MEVLGVSGVGRERRQLDSTSKPGRGGRRKGREDPKAGAEPRGPLP